MRQSDKQIIATIGMMAVYSDQEASEKELKRLRPYLFPLTDRVIDLIYQQVTAGKVSLKSEVRKLSSHALYDHLFETIKKICLSDNEINSAERAFLNELREIIFDELRSHSMQKH